MTENLQRHIQTGTFLYVTNIKERGISRILSQIPVQGVARKKKTKFHTHVNSFIHSFCMVVKVGHIP